MKKLLIASLFVMSGILGFAQQDQKAKSILENVTKTTRSFQSIQASFDYVMDNKQGGIHEVNKGDIIMKGDKYQLKLAQLGMEVYCDGKTVWSYMKDANEVSITSIEDESSEVMNPSKLFTIYEQGFNYKFIGESAAAGKQVYVIDLFPQAGDKDISRIRVQIDKQQMLIQSAEMFGKEGNNYTVRVNNMKTNVPAADGLFTFDAAKHPGVEIVDLR